MYCGFVLWVFDYTWVCDGCFLLYRFAVTVSSVDCLLLDVCLLLDLICFGLVVGLVGLLFILFVVMFVVYLVC